MGDLFFQLPPRSFLVQLAGQPSPPLQQQLDSVLQVQKSLLPSLDPHLERMLFDLLEIGKLLLQKLQAPEPPESRLLSLEQALVGSHLLLPLDLRQRELAKGLKPPWTPLFSFS